MDIGSLIWLRRAKDASINGDKETPLEISTPTSGVGEEFEYVRDNSSLLSLQPWMFRKGDGGIARVNRNQGSLVSRRLRDRSHLEPLGYNEHLEVGDYLLGSPPNSPVPAFRPFCVSGGERSIIGKSRFDSLGVSERDGGTGCGGGVDLGLKGVVVGVPPLPGSRRSIRKRMEVESVSFGASGLESSWKSSHSQGSVDRILHFCLGISIGMLSTILLNRVEVQKLNKLLKHNEDLVQDLQEEMEMRDSLSVKQLIHVSCENQLQFDTEESIGLWENENPSSNLTAHKKKEDDPHLHKEPLSKIEAELEVELERLEQTINASDEEQRISDLSELDPDLLCDVVHGELLVKNLTSELANSTSKSGTTSTAQTYNANYSVSPKELSIRLHEVIQMRLQERIEELEGELVQRKKLLHSAEGDRMSSQRTLSNSDIDFSSNQESPRMVQPDGAIVRPFLLNISGDILNAYEEAYEEFVPVACQEKPQPSINKSEWIEGCGSNSSSISPLWENMLWSRESIDTPKKDEEDSESDYFDDDEEAKLLIQQILERKRQGSPVLINAQKIFSSLDE